MNLAQKLRSYPFHTIGITLFFITNGYSAYPGLIPLKDLLLYWLLWLAISGLIFYFFYRKLKDRLKAGLLTTPIIAFLLFYGVLQDKLKQIASLAFLSKYSVLVTLFMIGVVAGYIYCRRTTKKMGQVSLYLNLLFVVFIVFDLANISLNTLNGKTNYLSKTKIQVPGLEAMKIEKKDIYLIVADEYSGTQVLRDSFHYDNSPFEKQLRDRGFSVAPQSRCNYTHTALAIASMFNMDYLEWIKTHDHIIAEDYTIANKFIAESDLVTYLQQQQYSIVNNSIFDLADQPSRFQTGLMSFKLRLITSKTLASRMEKDLIWIVHNMLYAKVNWLAKLFQTDFEEGNQRLIRLTKEEAARKSTNPRFVYTHLVMPHAPFLRDSTGKEVSLNYFDDALNNTKTREQLKHDYLQYLVYSNKVFTGLVDDILAKTNRQAIIVFMSDHGFRILQQPAAFNNFNAVYLPGGQLNMLDSDPSNVNQFRVIFNALSDQKLPLLKDSMVVF